MPKLKSHRGMKKRLKLTAGGKFRFKKTGARHLMIRNSNANKRCKRKVLTVDPSFHRPLRRMLPYL